MQWRNRWHSATFTSKSGYVMKYDRRIMRNITPHWHDWISAKWFQCEKTKGGMVVEGKDCQVERKEQGDIFCSPAGRNWSSRRHVLTCLKNLLHCLVELIISCLRPWLPACCFLLLGRQPWVEFPVDEGCLWQWQLEDQPHWPSLQANIHN